MLAREKNSILLQYYSFFCIKNWNTHSIYTKKTIVKIFKYTNSVTKENSGKKSIKRYGVIQVSVLISSVFSNRVKVIYYAFGASGRKYP